MRKDSPLIIVWDNDTIVGIFIHCPTTSHPQPTRTEEELVRIFSEHKQLQAQLATANAENERLRAEHEQAIKFLEEALPHIACENHFQNGLIVAIGTFLQALEGA